jgi:hypothetical protein
MKKNTNLSFSSGHFKSLKSPEAATTKKNKENVSKRSIMTKKNKSLTLPGSNFQSILSPESQKAKKDQKER